MADFPFQTTQTAVQLVLNGVMDRYPDVRVILSHAGGFLPYASLRFAELARVFNPDAPSPDVILASLRRFYFDTALASGPALPTLIAFAGSSRILFGTDSPYEHGVSAAFTAALDADSSLTADDRARPEPPPGPVTAKPSPLGEIASARAIRRSTVTPSAESRPRPGTQRFRFPYRRGHRSQPSDAGRLMPALSPQPRNAECTAGQ
jgi:Amidohydrolase